MVTLAMALSSGLNSTWMFTKNISELKSELRIAIQHKEKYMDEFYELLNFVIFSCLTTSTHKINDHISVLSGPSALASCTMIMLGKKTTVGLFHASCNSFYIYLNQNFCERNIEYSISPEYSEKKITQIVDCLQLKYRILELLVKYNAKLKMIILPFVGSQSFAGTVLIQERPMAPYDCDCTMYTLVLPRTIDNASMELLENVLISELAVCVSDIVSQYDIELTDDEIQVLNQHEWGNHHRHVHCVNVMYPNGTSAKNHRRYERVKRLYRPIAAIMTMEMRRECTTGDLDIPVERETYNHQMLPETRTSPSDT